MYFSHVQHIVFILQFFFGVGGRIGISSSCFPKLQPKVDQDKIQPPEQLSQALKRLLCRGGAPHSLNVWGYKCLSQLLQEHLPLVPLIRHPGRVDHAQYHEGIV
jgi:hypothetical protein